MYSINYVSTYIHKHSNIMTHHDITIPFSKYYSNQCLLVIHIRIVLVLAKNICTVVSTIRMLGPSKRYSYSALDTECLSVE